jgi:hypothetical protein
VLCFELILRGYANPYLISLLWLFEGSAAITGLLLASYTGVLIGATAVPVWSQNRELLPAHFLTSGLGGSAAILELAGFLIPATQVLGFVASGIETLIESFLEVRKRPVDVPLHHGRSGKALRIAELLEGPAALLVPGVLGRFSYRSLCSSRLLFARIPANPIYGFGPAALWPMTPRAVQPPAQRLKRGQKAVPRRES